MKFLVNSRLFVQYREKTIVHGDRSQALIWAHNVVEYCCEEMQQGWSEGYFDFGDGHNRVLKCDYLGRALFNDRHPDPVINLCVGGYESRDYLPIKFCPFCGVATEAQKLDPIIPPMDASAT